MKIYTRGGVVLATHDDAQNVPPSAYGEGVALLTAPAGTVVAIGGPVPALDIEAMRTAVAAQVDGMRDAFLASGYQHNFGGSAGIRTLDNRDERDAINWLGLKGLADAMIAAGDGDDLLSLRDAANDTFPASAVTVSTALIGMAVWRASVLAASWALKDAITAAEDEAALDAIDLDAGWPE